MILEHPMNKKLLPTLISILFIAFIWQIISYNIAFPSVFPSLIDLIVEIFKLFVGYDFIKNVSETIFRGILGFVFAFGLALLFATIAGFSSFWKAFFHPIIILTRSIPVISFVLIAMLWFSPELLPVYIALITMFPIIYQSTLSGFEHTDIKLIEMAKVFGKTPLNRYFSIYVQSSKKYILDGVSTAMGFGWRAIIIGEALSQPIHGIGSEMKRAQVYINVSELMAWTVIAIAVSYFFEGVIKVSYNFHFHKKRKITNNHISNDIGAKTLELKAIEFVNIKKSFNEFIAFNNFSLLVTNEHINCLKGPSGVGKTTLLRLISKLDKLDNGIISKSEDYRMAFSFQDIRLLPWLTIYDNIKYGVNSSNTENKISDFEIQYLIENMELQEHLDKYPNELSGGEQQRVGLVRALVAKSDVLLLDEPLNGLDKKLKINVMNTISEWISVYKPIVILATHENVAFKTLEVRDIVL